MGSEVPKQFLLIHGKPVLWYTLDVFLSAYDDLSVILVVPAAHREAGRAVIAASRAGDRIRMTDGGVTRFDSVRKGLEFIQGESVIFVHDAVRCLLSPALVHRCYEQALRTGSAIPVVDSRDSVRVLTETGSEAIERSRIRLVQTPQTFRSELLLNAYRTEYAVHFTDDATVVEASGHAVHLVEGESDNIKLTVPADMVVAERLLRGK
jgi:2-C-methyl-D-erythritol 4-phosphate cytidylyltransferase